jgi:hypothetical protein
MEVFGEQPADRRRQLSFAVPGREPRDSVPELVSPWDSPQADHDDCNVGNAATGRNVTGLAARIR